MQYKLGSQLGWQSRAYLLLLPSTTSQLATARLHHMQKIDPPLLQTADGAGQLQLVAEAVAPHAAVLLSVPDRPCVRVFQDLGDPWGLCHRCDGS